jgi:CRP-like cAMP-binding protein
VEGLLSVEVNSNIVNYIRPGTAFGEIGLLYSCPRYFERFLTVKNGNYQM